MDLPRPTGDLTLNAANGKHGNTPAPVQPAINSPSDLLRLKLRQIARRHVQDGGNPDLPTLPGVNVLALATRYIEGGRPRFIEYVQLAALNRYAPAVNWWLVYRDLTPGERSWVSYDDVCAAAQVRPSEFLACVVQAATEFSQDTGNLVAAAMHPAVVHQAGRSAKRIGGRHANIALQDRKMMFEHAQFIPSAKFGTTVNVNASASAQAAAAAAQDPSVPSFASDMAALGSSRLVVHKSIEGEVLPAGGIDGGAENAD